MRTNGVVKIDPVPPHKMIELLHLRVLKLLRQGKVSEAIAASTAMMRLMTLMRNLKGSR